MVATLLAPGIDSRLAESLGAVALISGTNGKTTTSKLLSGILAATGRPPIANASGANLRQSIASTLVAAAARSGSHVNGHARAVFEVDEAVLGEIRGWLPRSVIVLTNLFRDQLDRFGETDHIVRLWTSMLRDPRATGTVVYPVDDPRLAALVMDTTPRGRRFGFGVDRAAGLDLPDVARHDHDACPRCGSELVREGRAGGDRPTYACTSCGFHRPEPDLSVSIVASHGFAGQTLCFAWADGSSAVEVGIPGGGNAANAAAAVSAAMALGVPAAAAVAALGTAEVPFGRFEQADVDGVRVVVSLLKNPAGMTDLAGIAREAEIDSVLVAVNDAFADGRDVSWYWDCSPGALLAGRPYIVAGSRAADFALRVGYELGGETTGGMPKAPELVPDPVAGLDLALAQTPAGGTLLVVATYTAMLAIRAALARRALVPAMPA